MRNATGYMTVTGPSGDIKEADSFTCGHCQKVTFVPVKAAPEDLGGLCKQCMGLICAHCYKDGTCTPIMKRIEQEEAKYEALRSYGLA